MNKKYILRALPIMGTLVALTMMSASAQTLTVTGSSNVHLIVASTSSGLNLSTGSKAAVQIRLTNIINRADQEIQRRITALNTLNTRVNAMVKLSDSEKSSLSSSIQAQISAMNALQAQIGADSSSTSALKTDVQSITKSYRIFALILPQGAIEALADRAETIVSDIGTVATKLQTRISQAQSSGANVTAAVSAMSDLNAKTADANVQAQAAVSEVSSLQPDNGVQTIMQSNTAALKDARAKLKVAQQDLVAARQDAGTIIKTLESLKVSAGVSASSTTNSQ